VKLSNVRRALILFAIGLLAVASLGLAACNGDDDGDQSGSSGTGGVMIAIITLDRAGLHGIDESLNRDGKVPSGARNTALQMQTLVKLTTWPENLRSQANALAGILGEMAAALDGEKIDVQEASFAAKRAHDAQHEFSGLVWAELYRQAGVRAPANGHN
jgi:hypothetical protein